MHDRSALGPANVSDEQLATMVAGVLECDPASTTLATSFVDEVAYDLPAITTAGRFWVQGLALVGGREVPFKLFAKHVQSWTRSPLFDQVPLEFREQAAASVPWRTEALVYRSDLHERLPEGLTMPRCLGVFDLDELSACIWLEPVEIHPVAWTTEHYAHVASLLGRMAAAPGVIELATVGGHDFHVRDYVRGRLEIQVLPMLHDPQLWEHPLVAGAFDATLRRRLLAAADLVTELVEELSTYPLLTSHGDACPNNLLTTDVPDQVVLIDFGFWTLQPVGFDLAQLLVGDAQLGRTSTAMLAEIEQAILPAYVAGLRAEGCDIALDDVRRAHALQLLLFTGLSALPVELLDQPPSPALRRTVDSRAEIIRFSLDLLDATS
ncbi:MAG: phosphotransferase [Marmoricola sp.]